MTTREEIRTWLLEGKALGATHTIIACDTFDYSDFPVHIMPGEDVRKKESELDKVMEVYSHAVDHEAQLNETRSWHYETSDEVLVRGEVDTRPTEVDFTRWRALLAEARNMLDRHDYPEEAMRAIEQEIKPHASFVSERAHDVSDACYAVASQAKRFFVTSKGKRVDGEHLLALNARQSDTISGLASENQALRQGHKNFYNKNGEEL